MATTDTTKEVRQFLNTENPLEKILTTLPDNPEKTKRELAEFFMKTIKPYYENQNLSISSIVFNLISEAFLNSHYHGGDYKPHISTTTIFLSPTALISKHNDNGTYFKRQEVKEHWENKIKFPEKHRVDSNNIGGGVGTPLIYYVADFIQVDIISASLYLGTSVANKNNFQEIPSSSA